jgi:hypothetical protein
MLEQGIKKGILIGRYKKNLETEKKMSCNASD